MRRAALNVVTINRNFTSSSTSSHQFQEFSIKTPRFNLIIDKLTTNTFVLAVLPPGDAELNCTRINIATAREDFTRFDTPPGRVRMGDSSNADYGVKHKSRDSWANGGLSN